MYVQKNNSAFGIRHSAFGIRHSAFGIRHSAFGHNDNPVTNIYKKPAVPINTKTVGVVLLFCFCISFCYAKSSIDFFVGAGGKLALPSASKKANGGAGTGGGGYAEGGIEFLNIQTELFTSVSYLSSGGLVKSILETEIGLGTSYVFSKKNLHFLPVWLAFRPHISVYADIYAANVYKNAVQKEEGTAASVRGVTAGFSPGFFFDFPNLITLNRVKIIPTVGFEESIRFDRVSGIYATPLFNVGIRFFWDLPKNNPPSPQREREVLPDKETEPEKLSAKTTAQSELIQLPFIIFPPNAASLFEDTASSSDDAAAEAAKNTLNEIAKILIENPDFNIVIIGYANNVTGTGEENQMELLPLSLQRSQYIHSELEKRGIAPMRMTVRGEGAGEYLSTEEWKNRRVEFLLIKEHE